MTYGTLPPGGYPSSSKWFHWLVAISVIIQAPLGIILVYAELGAWQDRLYNFHKSLGVLILILMILRVLNRLIVGAPAAEPTIARWQHSVSSAVHGALYVLLILQALVGYWANSAFGASTPFFGLFEIPAIGGKNDALSNTAFHVAPMDRNRARDPRRHHMWPRPCNTISSSAMGSFSGCCRKRSEGASEREKPADPRGRRCMQRRPLFLLRPIP